jgi:3-deoxy-D-arabino-heptulosonate 7-phosphate (DAHP) synthase
MIAPQMQEAAKARGDFQVVTLDDVKFPAEVAKRVGKPTNAKVATAENLAKISSAVDVVVIGLSD